MPYVERPGKPRLHYTVDDHTDSWRNAPYLVLQHGNGRSGRFWYRWIPYLSRYYKVVRPDLRGLGQSGKEFDLDRDMTPEALVEDQIAVIDALGADSVHFCGESMGGILGIALASIHPQRVRTLTLVATPVFISDRMKETYSLGHGSRIDAMKQMGIRAWIDATNRSTRFPPDTPQGMFDWYADEFVKSDPQVQLSMARLVNQANAAQWLPGVRAPVLGLYPSAGQITSSEQEQMLTAALPGMRIVHLPTSYHMVHMIHPATCAGHVLHFVAAHDGVPVHER
jgi:3-oxoadipate enol-lactonase